MKDAHLAFLLLDGLDFLRAARAILELAQNRYGLEAEGGYMHYYFSNAWMTLEQSTMSAGESRLHPATVSLYYSLPLTTHHSLPLNNKTLQSGTQAIKRSC